ncbi:MAG: hypothetical protein FWG68_09770, partial [Defluviitaleaceae bacterium]|nr:hypothetical protein [Defluviitaleaceae bacterium]
LPDGRRVGRPFSHFDPTLPVRQGRWGSLSANRREPHGFTVLNLIYANFTNQPAYSATNPHNYPCGV